MEKIEIPRKAVYRLSVYQRCLQRLRENAVETVSSEALSKAAGVKSTQLRKDLGYVGQFGTRGLGYNVETLSEAIVQTLGSTSLQPVILVGVGNLGSALLRYSGFRKEGFEIVAAFDQMPEAVRVRDTGIPVMAADRMAGFVKERQVKMAILAVPANHAQAVANELVEAGVQAILNFSPTVIQVPEQVVVNTVDLAIELESLSYFIR
ncbi:MAG: redox-sensing transcriptional repressor Rex [Verrucomicrobiae bacterium]|nr:redox-sensing transcriptional repressor Rex [Verrucomicrobiae bacterium]MCP5542197.1 redox-sensing transcriptional repressor Rex [Akkermansiaceae bacterium]